jgi:hypothetical protein
MAQPVACAFSRDDLQFRLRDQHPYDANFFLEGDTHHCRGCGLAVDHHCVVGTAMVHRQTPAFRLANVAAPSLTIAQFNDAAVGSVRDDGTRITAYPLHWKSAVWYAPFLAFTGYVRVAKVLVDPDSSRSAAPEQQLHFVAQWRCTAQRADGSECGATFETKGRDPENPIIDMRPVAGAGDSIEQHFIESHGLRPVPAGGFRESFYDVCAHPMAAAACCFCYWLPVPCTPGFGFAAGLAESIPAHSSDATTSSAPRTHVPSFAPDRTQCRPAVLAAPLCLLRETPAAVLGCLVFGCGSLLTLCGFPCGSDAVPPLLCISCYRRRRAMVEALGATESNAATRAKVVFCCPCSELQLWREVRSSGVWPGLPCCAASQADRDYMAPSAVRQRYSVDGHYGVNATTAEGVGFLTVLNQRPVSDVRLCFDMR